MWSLYWCPLASFTSRAIWTRLFTSSLSSRRETWALTVGTERCRAAAISALAWPRPTARATSRSRGLSVASRSRAWSALAPASESPATIEISLRVTVGESIPSPAWASSIARTISAGGVSLRRKPAAPACSARRTSSSASKVVRGGRPAAGPRHPARHLRVVPTHRSDHVYARPGALARPRRQAHREPPARHRDAGDVRRRRRRWRARLVARRRRDLVRRRAADRPVRRLPDDRDAHWRRVRRNPARPHARHRPPLRAADVMDGGGLAARVLRDRPVGGQRARPRPDDREGH